MKYQILDTINQYSRHYNKFITIYQFLSESIYQFLIDNESIFNWKTLKRFRYSILGFWKASDMF